MSALSRQPGSELIDTMLPGLSLRCGDLDTLRHCIDSWLAEADTRHTVAYVNPHVYNMACRESAVAHFLATADIVCIDGIGIQLSVWQRQRQWVPRVVAEHLFNALLLQGQTRTRAILIGATDAEAVAAAEAMNAAAAAITIVDTLDGYQALPAYTAFIEHYRDIPLLLIGAGSPKSETIAALAAGLRSRGVIFHIGGGTLKTWAGTKRRSPPLVSRLGLEWAHRCVFEPHTRSRYLQGGREFLHNLDRAANLGRLPRPGDYP